MGLFDFVHELKSLGLKVKEFVFRYGLCFFGFNNQVEVFKLALQPCLFHFAEFHLNRQFVGSGLSELLFFLAESNFKLGVLLIVKRLDFGDFVGLVCNFRLP